MQCGEVTTELIRTMHTRTRTGRTAHASHVAASRVTDECASAHECVADAGDGSSSSPDSSSDWSPLSSSDRSWSPSPSSSDRLKLRLLRWFMSCGIQLFLGS